MGGRNTAAAVRTSDDFEQVPVRIVEIDSAPIVPAVDLVALPAKWVRPIGVAARTNSRKDFVKFHFGDQKREVPGRDLALGIDVVERSVTHGCDRKRTQQRRCRKVQNLRQKRGCRELVASSRKIVDDIRALTGDQKRILMTALLFKKRR